MSWFLKKSKNNLVLAVLLLYTMLLNAQNISLIPKEVYVGDEAEIRFGFDWDGSLFPEGSESNVTLVTQDSMDETLVNDYTIKSMQLFPTQDGYMLSILFIPWKAGFLDMEAFDIATVFSINVNSLLIDIPEVQIKSILTNIEDKSLMPPTGPVIVPGTTYILVALTLIALVVCLLIIIVFARRHSIKAWLKTFFGKIWSSDNFKKASRDLIMLSKQKATLDPKIFAAKLSMIIRTYLEGRFLHRFTAEATSSFFVIFDSLFAGTVSSKANDVLQELYEICVRCDFLHYAGLETEKAPLTQDESESLIERTRQAIMYFEKDSDEEGEGTE